MAKKKSAFNPRLQAARRKKQVLVLAVLFVALMAFQVPRTLKMLRGSAPAQATSSTVTPTVTTPSLAPGATAPVANAQLASATDTADALVVNADLQPAPLDGQLANLTTFRSKDPFVQQVDASAAGSSSSSPSSSAAGAGKAPTVKPAAAKAPKPTVGAVPSTAPSTVPPTGTRVPVPAAPAPTSAVLSVNGIQEGVNVGSDFPASDPLFHLVSLTAKSGKISIAGGSLSSGAPAVTIQLGKPTTLMNTADGTRYVIVLVSVGASTTTPTATQQSP